MGTASVAGPSSLGNFGGTAMGGPTPIQNAKVILYITSSSGYGTAKAISYEADTQGTTTGQDTDANGFFHFTLTGRTPAFSCDAGQFAYIVIYGGDTGGGNNNPNSVLMAPVGSCDALYSGTTYTGNSFLVVNELTTIASAYALGNFMTVTGNAKTGYAVGIGAPASNSNPYGCVNNIYYTGATAPSLTRPVIRMSPGIR